MFFRWFFEILLLVLVPLMPSLWWMMWTSEEHWNIAGLNQSASYHDTPGLARERTWHVAGNWPWVCLLFLAIFVAYHFLIFRWSHPDRDPVIERF